MKYQFRVGEWVTLTHLETVDQDVPKRYIGRSGIIEKRMPGGSGEPPVYTVRFRERKEPLHLYEDEVRPSK